MFILNITNIKLSLYFYYGAGLQGHTNWREVQSVKNKTCRLFLDFASTTSNVASQEDMEYNSTKQTQSLQTFRLFLRVRNTYDTRYTCGVGTYLGHGAKNVLKRIIASILWMLLIVLIPIDINFEIYRMGKQLV